MDWQLGIVIMIVGACVWKLGRKFLGKSKKTGACEHCVPGGEKKSSH